MRLEDGKFERESARLARLPRADRFEELLTFPTRHAFKVIGPHEGLVEGVRVILDDLGMGEDVILVERHSKSGRYISITLELLVKSGAHLDEVYTALERLDGVSYVF